MLGSNSKKAKSNSSSKVDTLIGHETRLTGDLRFAGGLHIDGVVQGNVHAEPGADDALAIVSERGRVEGELRVPTLLINGYVSGDVHATTRLDLAKNARIQGDVYYHVMEMASGAEINGKLVRIDQEQRYLEHRQSFEAADIESPTRDMVGGGPDFDDDDVAPDVAEHSFEPDPVVEPGDKT